MALTASAPADVEAVIQSSLHMHEPVVVSQSLDRANIYMSASVSKGMKVRVKPWTLPAHIHFMLGYVLLCSET